MPLFYNSVPGSLQTTNATGGTANDCFFLSPGTRTAWLRAVLPNGAANAATSLSGIRYRVEKWTTTASSGGTAVTPSPIDKGAQACKASAGWSASTVTSGTGGPTLMLAVGSGLSTPGPWIAQQNLDDAPNLEASATMSLDIFNVCAAASQSFEMTVSHAE